jgi:hypothetical protein
MTGHWAYQPRFQLDWLIATHRDHWMVTGTGSRMDEKPGPILGECHVNVPDFRQVNRWTDPARDCGATLAGIRTPDGARTSRALGHLTPRSPGGALGIELDVAPCHPGLLSRTATGQRDVSRSPAAMIPVSPSPPERSGPTSQRVRRVRREVAGTGASARRRLPTAPMPGRTGAAGKPRPRPHHGCPR